MEVAAGAAAVEAVVVAEAAEVAVAEVVAEVVEEAGEAAVVVVVAEEAEAAAEEAEAEAEAMIPLLDRLAPDRPGFAMPSRSPRPRRHVAGGPHRSS